MRTIALSHNALDETGASLLLSAIQQNFSLHEVFHGGETDTPAKVKLAELLNQLNLHSIAVRRYVIVFLEELAESDPGRTLYLHIIPKDIQQLVVPFLVKSILQEPGLWERIRLRRLHE